MFYGRLTPALITIFLFSSCSKDEIPVNPSPEPEHLFTVAINIAGIEGPLPDAAFTFDSLNTTTDSTGLLIFRNVQKGSYVIKLSHKDYRSIDSSLTIGTDTSLSIVMELKNNSFFPLTIGSKWIYRDSWNKLNKTVEALDFIEITGLIYTKFSEVVTNDGGSVKERDTYFYRISNDTLYKYISGNFTGGAIYALFNAPWGTEFTRIEGNEIWQIPLVGKIITKKPTEIRIYYDNPSIWDEEHSIYFRRGVGITQTSNVWQVYILTDYDIKY